MSLNRAESFLSLFRETVETVLGRIPSRPESFNEQDSLNERVKSPIRWSRDSSGGWTMQPIFRRSQSYLRERNQSVGGRAHGEMKVSRFRRTGFGRWSGKRPRWKDWSLTAVCLNEMTHKPGGYTRWEMQFLFGSLHWLQSTREGLCPPSFFHRVNPSPQTKSITAVYRRGIYTDYPVDRAKK